MNKVYANSVAATKVAATSRISMVDIDGTFVFESERNEAAWNRELEVRKKVKKILESRGALVSITMRTPAMMMSDASFRLAQKRGYAEREPHLGLLGSKRVWQAPETFPEYRDALDWDIVGGVGSGILVKHDVGYFEDALYAESLGDRSLWRKTSCEMLAKLDEGGDILSRLSPLENEKNYNDGIITGAPIPYRIELLFTGDNGQEEKRRVKEKIAEARHAEHDELRRWASGIVLFGESRPHKKRYSLFIVPKYGEKKDMLKHIIQELSEASEVPAHALKLFVAGDMPHDIRAGLEASSDVSVVCLLAGGSPLAPYVGGYLQGRDFAGESLLWLTSRLSKTQIPGMFMWGGSPRRRLIIGDLAFPGTRGPETIAAWLENEQMHNLGG